MLKFKRSNSMKRVFWIIFVVTSFVLAVTGCSPAATTTPIPIISLDATETSALSQVKASAVVVPAQESRLSFVISGMVEDVTIEEGDQVQAGQALVKLDTTELEYRISCSRSCSYISRNRCDKCRDSARKNLISAHSNSYVSAHQQKRF